MAGNMKRKNMSESVISYETHKVSDEFEKQLLLPTIYGLNRSFTKKVLIGFQEEKKDGQLYPIIRLIGNDFSGISFNTNAWCCFQKQFNAVSEYLNGESDNTYELWNQQQITTREFLITFSISYGQRSIIIEKLEVLKENDEKESKKKKPYRCVIMQKSTFDNLKELCICINERLNHLERIIICVNLCKDALVKWLRTEIQEKNEFEMVLYSVKNVVKKENKIIENYIREYLNIKYPTFVEHEFRIIFLELTTMYQIYISQCVFSDR